MWRNSYYQTAAQLPSRERKPGLRRAGRVPAPLGGWRCDMRVSQSPVQKRTFPDRTAAASDAGLRHRVPLGPRANDGTAGRSFAPRRCDCSPRPAFTEPPLPATEDGRSIRDGAAAPHSNSVHAGRTAIAAHQALDSRVRLGWSNEGREVFAAWILVLLSAALAVLLLASHQPSTSDFRLPQWSDPPIAGAESWPRT
jgi:hypothetical protein